MCLVLAVWDELGGIVVSEGRSCDMLPDGRLIPVSDDTFKIARIREDLVLACTGETHINEIILRSVKEYARFAAFADFERSIIPDLVAECCRNYPGENFNFDVLLLGNDAGKTRCVGWCRGMSDPKEPPTARSGTFAIGYPAAEAHELVASLIWEPRKKPLDLGDTREKLADIVRRLAPKYPEVMNDRLKFETVVASNGNQRPSAGGVANAGVGQMYSNLDRTSSGVLPKIISNKASFSVLTSGVQNVIKSNTIAGSVAYTVKADCYGGSFSGGTPVMTAGIVGRCLDANNLYLAQIDGSNNVVTLFKIVGGTVTSLGTFTHTGPSATLSLQITDAAKVVFVNGVQRITSADNALAAAGSPGFWLSQSAATVITSPTVDNFSAMYIQNVAAPPTPTNNPPAPPGPIVFDPGSGNQSGTGGGREINKL